MRHSLKPFTAAVLAAIALATTGVSFAQQTPPPGLPPAPPAGSARPDAPPPPDRPARPAPQATRGEQTQVSGRVQTLLVNPSGDIDGLLLADGMQVAFAPQPATGLALKPGDQVQVSGWPGTRAQVLRAERLSLSGSGRSLLRARPEEGVPPPPPRRPEAMAALTAMSTSGKVARVLYTDRGDANGVLLDNGSILRFPPMQDAAAAAAMQPGKTLFATGWGSRSSGGNAIEATAIGTSLTTMQNVMPGRPPEPKPAGRKGPRGPMPPPPAGAGNTPPPPAP